MVYYILKVNVHFKTIIISYYVISYLKNTVQGMQNLLAWHID